jgi:hypothetical protein
MNGLAPERVGLARSSGIWNLVDRVELPAGSRLVGFDPRWLYTSRTDSDGFEHPQRFPLSTP